jgi:alkylation response protein AidB-like acyl-CoA dehydrogenase
VDLSVSNRQVALADAVRALCAGRADPRAWESLVSDEPGYDRELWSELLQSGLVTGGFSERAGGSGGSLADLGVVIEELASVPLPTPILNGLVLTGQVLGQASGNGTWLADLLAGRRRFATLLSDAGRDGAIGVVSTTESVAGEWILDGTVPFVPYAASADELVVVTADSAHLFIVEADAIGVSMEAVPTVGGDRRCHIRLASVPVRGDRALVPSGGTDSWLSPVLAVARAMVAADMVGAAAASLDHATKWAKSRVQFATPIGSFQAVQHRLADALIDVTTARDAVYDALGRLDRHEPGEVAAAAAKAYATDACRRVTATAHQVCGGEGIYTDQPVHLWHRRVAGLAAELGTVRTGREAVAAALLD